MCAAERHENSACADSRVELFNESLLRAYVQVGHKVCPAFSAVLHSVYRSSLGSFDNDVSILGRAVGVKEITGNITNCITVPCHCKSCISLNLSNDCCLKVFCCRKLHKSGSVCRLYNNCHSFLRFGNSNFSTVKTVILLGNCIKVDCKTVCQLTSRTRNTACAKVVTSLDKT